MIVTSVEQTVRTLRAGYQQVSSRSLARRGFFFSETEAVDHVRLAPGAMVDVRGRRGTEEAWFVVSGDGELLDVAEAPQHLRPLSLAVCPLNSGVQLRAGAEGMELVLIAVAPRELTDAMPARLPVAS